GGIPDPRSTTPNGLAAIMDVRLALRTPAADKPDRDPSPVGDGRPPAAAPGTCPARNAWPRPEQCVCSRRPRQSSKLSQRTISHCDAQFDWAFYGQLETSKKGA